MKNFGSKLKLLREEKKMTQTEVAEKLNVTRQSISNWETNKNYPDVISLVSLSKLYDTSLDILLNTEREVVESMKQELDSYTGVDMTKLIIFSILAFILPIVGIAFVILLLTPPKNVPYYKVSKLIGYIALTLQIIFTLLLIIGIIASFAN
ncbi:helix-turn-helix domain-containing protein [Listeria sp. PSOL-1]|uniref:helix-turn-helix domain-containing protein n=1 Tax=Listeria sp. PSOL-1 TaxID=1844999 RepID=UPI0013D65988|nr:helix-turn-helix transcriptional regulator [Listeria sp. PSOL-1]